MPHLEMTEAKRKIFEVAIRLFAEKNFEAVTMNDIAKEIGCKKPSLYAHFISKQQILDTIYNFILVHFPADRPTMEQVEPILRNGSVLEMMNACIYGFGQEYEDLLLSSVIIINQRLRCDEAARSIYKKLLVQDGLDFVETVFTRAIEIGRLAPFDVHALSVLLNNNRHCLLRDWMLDSSPEKLAQVYQDEQMLMRYAALLITDLKPPKDKTIEENTI